MVSLVVNMMLGIVIGGGLLKKNKEASVKVVTRVIDGDTVVFSDGGHGRLVGIDAPEYRKACLSKRSKDRLEELVLGKEVEVVNTGKRSFERDLIWVSVDGVSVNKVMVGEGLAIKFEDYTPEIEMAEDEAKTTKRGIWSSECLPEKEGCVIKGNYRKGVDKKYHLPECYNYKSINLNPIEPDEWFCTEKQAEKAGFVKANDCPGMK